MLKSRPLRVSLNGYVVLCPSDPWHCFQSLRAGEILANLSEGIVQGSATYTDKSRGYPEVKSIITCISGACGRLSCKPIAQILPSLGVDCVLHAGGRSMA